MARLGGDEVTALTARPITAVPITARPITARRIGEGDGPSVRTLLSIALQSTLVPGIAAGSGTPTYTRSTVATVTDFEGLVKNVRSGEARFMGARRVVNLLTLPFTNPWLWTVQNSATLSSGGDLYFPGLASNESLICRNISIDATGRRYAARIKIKAKAAGDIGKKIRIYFQQNGPSYNVTTENEITLTADYVTYGVKMGAALSGSSTGGIRLMLTQATTPEEVTLTIADAQIEDVTGQSNQNPSEYVSAGVLSAPYHGAGVDGIKYFTAKNGNTVSSNIVTEATGAAIGSGDYYADSDGPFGYVSEGARTNLVTGSSPEILVNKWAAVGAGAGITQGYSAPDGSTNAARITATGPDGRVYHQSVIGSSATQNVISMWLKGESAGTVPVVIYDGTIFHNFTTAIATEWKRYTFNAPYTVSNIYPINHRDGTGALTVVHCWGVQCEADKTFASSLIPTNGAAVTRAATSGSYATTSNITSANGVLYLEWTPPYTGMGTVALWGSYVDANNYTRIFHDGTNIVFRRRVSGVNYDATKALTYAAGTTYKIAARISNATGGDVFIAGVKGTNSPNTSALQLGANFSVGHDGNGANHSFAPIRNVKHYDTALTDEQVAAL